MPKTKDGVPITPGIIVWASDGEATESLPVTAVSEDAIQWHDRKFSGAHMRRWLKADACYSTREAALVERTEDGHKS